MTVPSPRLRTAWRVGSALAAAAGSAVVTSALVNRSRNRSQRKQAPEGAGETPAPSLAGAAAAGDLPETTAPPEPPAGAELLVHDPPPATPSPPAPERPAARTDDLARAIQAADAVEAAPAGWTRVASELRVQTTAADNGWASSIAGLPAVGEPRVPIGPPTPAAGTAAAAAITGEATGTETPEAWDYGLSGLDTRVPRPPGEEDRRRPRRRHRTRPEDLAAAASGLAEPKADAEPVGRTNDVASAATTNGTVPSVATGADRRIGETPPGPPGPGSAGDVTPDRRMLLFVGVAVAVALLLGLAVVVLGGGGEDGDGQREQAAPAAGDRASTDAGTGGSTATTPVAQLSPAQAFAQAGQRLQAGGTFAYEGTSSATDVSPVRPGPWMGVDLTVEGQVQLLTPRLFERATAADGTVGETVTDGVTIWGRSAASFDALTETGLQRLYALPEPTPAKVGALLLPQWLTSSTGATDAGTDDQGRRTFRATLPANVLGSIEDGQAPAAAVVVLTLDQQGNPAHLEVTTESGPPLRLVYDILAIGQDMPIQIPGQTAGTGQTPQSTATP